MAFRMMGKNTYECETSNFFLIFISFYGFSFNLFCNYTITIHISRISSWADLPLKLSNLQNRTREVFQLQWGKRILYESHCLSDWLKSLCEPFEDTAVSCECEDEFLYPFYVEKPRTLKNFGIVQTYCKNQILKLN